MAVWKTLKKNSIRRIKLGKIAILVHLQEKYCSIHLTLNTYRIEFIFKINRQLIL